jgi:hypothetical protein
MSKVCGVCKLPGKTFHKALGNADGWQTSCKDCQRELNRKRRARFKAQNLGEDFEITVDEPPQPPLEVAYAEAHKSREKRDLKREHTALLDENARLKSLLDSTRAAMQPPEVIVYKKPAWERSDAVAMVVASDWHVEEPVDAPSIHGLNEYNLDIAKQRAELFFQNTMRLTNIMARDSKINTIFIAALGDFFSGWIHEELMASSLLAPGDAARFCKGLWVSGIDYLLRESPYVIEGEMIPGNHGRMTRQMHSGDPAGTSLESVMYESIADRYHGNPRVRLSVSNQAMVYRRFFEKFDVRFIHGYEVKYAGGVGGLTIPLHKAISQWDIAKRASLTVLGHFHQLTDGGNYLVNGSMIGYNLFAQTIKAKFEPPRQAFALLHARNGGEKALTGPVWVDAA